MEEVDRDHDRVVEDDLLRLRVDLDPLGVVEFDITGIEERVEFWAVVSRPVEPAATGCGDVLRVEVDREHRRIAQPEDLHRQVVLTTVDPFTPGGTSKGDDL